MKDRFLRWLGGYPRIEGVNMPPPGTHYVMFMVNGEAYTTEDLPKETAEIMAKNLGGIVMPVDMKGLNNERTE